MSLIMAMLQGVLCFFYPCMLHNIPVYLIYTASTSDSKAKGIHRFFSSVGFLLGLITLYTSLGALFQSVSALIYSNERIIYIIVGCFMVIFALGFFGIKPFCLLHLHVHTEADKKKNYGFFTAFIFGMICAASWIVCLLPFIVPVLMSTAASDSALSGAFIMLGFSTGLSVPLFLLSMLVGSSNKITSFIHKNERAISIITGVILLVIGIIMIAGWNTQIDEWFHHLTGTEHSHIA